MAWRLNISFFLVFLSTSFMVKKWVSLENNILRSNHFLLSLGLFKINSKNRAHLISLQVILFAVCYCNITLSIRLPPRLLEYSHHVYLPITGLRMASIQTFSTGLSPYHTLQKLTIQLIGEILKENELSFISFDAREYLFPRHRLNVSAVIFTWLLEKQSDLWIASSK